eukprot:12748382-Alexandrium_andersonii.AAC.1
MSRKRGCPSVTARRRRLPERATASFDMSWVLASFVEVALPSLNALGKHGANIQLCEATWNAAKLPGRTLEFPQKPLG